MPKSTMKQVLQFGDLWFPLAQLCTCDSLANDLMLNNPMLLWLILNHHLFNKTRLPPGSLDQSQKQSLAILMVLALVLKFVCCIKQNSQKHLRMMILIIGISLKYTKSCAIAIQNSLGTGVIYQFARSLQLPGSAETVRHQSIDCSYITSPRWITRSPLQTSLLQAESICDS